MNLNSPDGRLYKSNQMSPRASLCTQTIMEDITHVGLMIYRPNTILPSYFDEIIYKLKILMKICGANTNKTLVYNKQIDVE
jgi:hypothetical protein